MNSTFLFMTLVIFAAKYIGAVENLPKNVEDFKKRGNF